MEADPNPHQFADAKPKFRNINIFEHFLKSLILYLVARNWIRIRIWARIKQNNKNKNQNPDPHQGDADPQHVIIRGADDDLLSLIKLNNTFASLKTS